MDKYVVGSVADFISNKKQPKKEKPLSNSKIVAHKKDISEKVNNKNHTYEEDIEERENPKRATKVTYLSSSSSSSSSNKYSSKSPYKLSVQSLLNEDTFSETTKNKGHLSESKTPPKKKRKLSENFIESPENFEKKCKKINGDSIPLDHVPSDSEEEEVLEKNFKKKTNVKTEETSRDDKENTIFVGNIPINYDKQKVCKVFSKFGEIQNARIRCVPVENINMSKKVAAIKKKFNPKRNSLVAYVKYKSQDSANAALKANGMVIDGHHIRVDFAEQNKDRDNNKAVFVGGLPFDIEDDELWEFFKNCGEINSVRVVRDSQTSVGKGFGYVNFKSSASVELALQLDGQELKKRTINVKRCVKSRKKNKLNSFGKNKSREVASQLMSKKGKKFKEEKKKLKKKNNEFMANFQGKMADKKQKKKKKLSKVALRQRKLVKILQAS